MANFANPFNPGMQYHDDDGSPLNGGFLYFWEAGTSTAKTTWADGAMQTPNDNPVVLSSVGRATIFVQGLYKWSLTDADGVEKASGDDNKFEVVTGVAAELLDDTSKANQRATLGLGTAAVVDTGTAASEVVVLDATAKLPAVDGSQLTNIASATVSALRGYLAGLTLSRGGNQILSIAAGLARDSTNVSAITISAAITKTFSNFTAGTGNGGLDSGSVAASTWYHAWAIYNVSSALSDVLISISPTSPTMPSGYTLKRRIGSILTDGSSFITNFSQKDNEFLWTDPPLDINASGIGASAVTRTLTVPTGIEMWANLQVTFANPDGPASLYLSSLSADDEAPAGDTTAPLATIVAPTSSERYAGGVVRVRTNSSAQIRSRVSLANSSMDIVTLGWWDSLGRFD